MKRLPILYLARVETYASSKVYSCLYICEEVSVLRNPAYILQRMNYARCVETALDEMGYADDVVVC